MSTTRILRLTVFFSALALASLASACAPRELTPQQRVSEKDQQECSMLANSMSTPPYSSVNVLWSANFAQCMQERGYTLEQLQTIQY